jgi:hypothetical protein
MKKMLLMVLIGLGAFFYVYKVDIMRATQRVDTNTPAAFKASIEEIGKGLSAEEKVIFAKGIQKMSAEGTDLKTMLAMTGEDEVQWSALTKKLNGKSVREILVKGAK